MKNISHTTIFVSKSRVFTFMETLWDLYRTSCGNEVNNFVINKTNQSPPSVKHLFEVHLFKTCRLRDVYQI